MKSILTLQKSSPDFQKYIDGTFSKTERAIPIQSLNVNTKDETVTFEVVPLASINRPSFFSTFLKVIRLRQFIFILFPLFYILLDRYSEVKDHWLTIFSTVGLLFLYAAVQLRNDYHDHLNGIDRIQSSQASHVLQKGWWTASQVKKLSWFFASLSFFCSWPVILVFPKVLLIVFLSGLVLFWSLFRKESSFKNFPAGELAFGVLLGPLLCVGYDLSLTGEFSGKSFFFGLVWGSVILFKLHLHNFEFLLNSSQGGLKNIINSIGFDKSKIFLKSWWVFCLVLYMIYQSLYLPVYFWLGSVIILIFISRIFYKNLDTLSSPLGSSMASTVQKGVMLFNSFVALWTLEKMFFLVAPEFMGFLIQKTL